MAASNKIKCNNVPYRKGFVEILTDVHDSCINIETWSIHVGVDIARIDLTDENFPDDGVTGNTEIEMSVDEAEELVTLLRTAINKVKSGELKTKY